MQIENFPRIFLENFFKMKFGPLRSITTLNSKLILTIGVTEVQLNSNLMRIKYMKIFTLPILHVKYFTFVGIFC